MSEEWKHLLLLFFSWVQTTSPLILQVANSSVFDSSMFWWNGFIIMNRPATITSVRVSKLHVSSSPKWVSVGVNYRWVITYHNMNHCTRFSPTMQRQTLWALPSWGRVWTAAPAMTTRSTSSSPRGARNRRRPTATAGWREWPGFARWEQSWKRCGKIFGNRERSYASSR